jgi:hypothetical protein
MAPGQSDVGRQEGVRERAEQLRDDEDGREDAGADDHRAEQVLRGRSTC